MKRRTPRSAPPVQPAPPSPRQPLDMLHRVTTVATIVWSHQQRRPPSSSLPKTPPHEKDVS
ncbi:MAG: hypothetical protein U0670_24860 [Anaerolineae bacterium]